ncbi:uncharacterized protein [Amphiura filiformis]|uniref:uncharacterized protein isoform X2 n=1 Tax=Amphiura filiformis TaxID=82378 RepID=UPI003B216115
MANPQRIIIAFMFISIVGVHPEEPPTVSEVCTTTCDSDSCLEATFSPGECIRICTRITQLQFVTFKCVQDTKIATINAAVEKGIQEFCATNAGPTACPILCAGGGFTKEALYGSYLQIELTGDSELELNITECDNDAYGLHGEIAFGKFKIRDGATENEIPFLPSGIQCRRRLNRLQSTRTDWTTG